MFTMFSKDMLQRCIVQYLSQGLRGPTCRVAYWEVVNAILYKLKTGVQWHLLPVKSLIFSDVISWNTVYYYFRKWCKDGSWRRAWTSLMKEYKALLDLSTVQLDGSHSPAKRGGEAVAYQGRKKCKTTNILLLTDRNGLVVGCSKPVAGNHHDLYKIDKQLKEIQDQLTEMDIGVDGLFFNADAGFDATKFRETLEKEGITLNCPQNKRNASRLDSDIYFDEEMYKERFVVERTNAWMDSFRSVLVRQDTTVASWQAWHFIAFTVWIIKHRIEKL